MKVLHLMSGDLDSGAGKGAYRLHLGLLQLGVDSKIAGFSKNELGDKVINLSSFKNKVKRGLNRLLNNFFRGDVNSSGLFSLGYDYFNVFSAIDFSDYDIVHLHWINYGIGLKDIERLAAKHRVVWTMRDMWPFTGGCHYSLSCNKYVSGCHDCPIIVKKGFRNDTAKIMSSRKHIYKEIEFISISEWQQFEAEQTGLFRVGQVSTIYNSVDIDYFKDTPNKALVSRLGWREFGKPIIAIGAQNLSDPYKGGDKLRQVIAMLSNAYRFLVFGNGGEDLFSGLIDADYRCLGFLDESSLSEVFNASDLFLMLSTQEAFGKTVVESLSCGTPVACLANTGPAEILENVGTFAGIALSDLSSADKEIASVIEKGKSELINNRALISKKFSLQSVATQYCAFYSRVLNNPEAYDARTI